MADNKNQAQLLEDYGQNVLSGVGGGGEFVATITYDNDASAFVVDKTWEEIQSAYASGADFKVKYADSSGIYDCVVGFSYNQGNVAHVYAENSFGGEINDFDIYDDNGSIAIIHNFIEIPAGE